MTCRIKPYELAAREVENTDNNAGKVINVSTISADSAQVSNTPTE